MSSMKFKLCGVNDDKSDQYGGLREIITWTHGPLIVAIKTSSFKVITINVDVVGSVLSVMY